MDQPTVEDLDKTEANKALAVALIEDVLMGKNPSKITEHISSEEYHQHNPQIKDGLTGIVEAVEYLTSQNNMFKYTKIHKVLGEGNFVLTVSEGEWNGGKKHAFYDLFRMKEGKMVKSLAHNNEHWDVIQEMYLPEGSSWHTMQRNVWSSLAFLSVIAGAVYAMQLPLDDRAVLHLLLLVMSVMFICQLSGKHPKVSRNAEMSSYYL
jgi:predicted SnoaL-like aldol condensation-catalyzing enzyme